MVVVAAASSAVLVVVVEWEVAAAAAFACGLKYAASSGFHPSTVGWGGWGRWVLGAKKASTSSCVTRTAGLLFFTG